MECPVCGNKYDWDIEVYDTEYVSQKEMQKHCYCMNCNSQWSNTYELVATKVTKKPNKHDLFGAKLRIKERSQNNGL